MVTVSIRSTFYHFENEGSAAADDEQPSLLPRAVTAPLPHKASACDKVQFDLQMDSGDSESTVGSTHDSMVSGPSNGTVDDLDSLSELAVRHVDTADDVGLTVSDAPRFEGCASQVQCGQMAYFYCAPPVAFWPVAVPVEKESSRGTSSAESVASEASAGQAPVLLGRVGGRYAAHAAKTQREKGSSERTTLMLRNLPAKYTRDRLLDLLASKGFAGKVDFLYFPIDFETEVGLGYAFVNLQTPADAEGVKRSFDGFSDWAMPCNKVCSVSWSQPLQGLEAHVARYRNSPLMHELVPDTYRPMLFADGQRIAFPPPTKKIKAPRQGSKKMFTHQQ